MDTHLPVGGTRGRIARSKVEFRNQHKGDTHLHMGEDWRVDMNTKQPWRWGALYMQVHNGPVVRHKAIQSGKLCMWTGGNGGCVMIRKMHKPARHERRGHAVYMQMNCRPVVRFKAIPRKDVGS